MRFKRTIGIFRWPRHFLVFVSFSIALTLAIAPIALAAPMRLQDRSLYINSSVAGATTFYRMSFRYMSPSPVGSVEMLFCIDPIPYNPCVAPSGLDVSQASLSHQTGETGFNLTTKTGNKLVISRVASTPSDPMSSYTFDNIINPTYTGGAFSIRIKTFASSDGTGTQTDFGTIRSQITEGITIETQVPPMLIFCLAEKVQYDCVETNQVHYTDMGEIKSDKTLTAQSQMAAGTNASGGFVIIAETPMMSAGTNMIESPTQPTASQTGKNQFGINLVENPELSIGSDPEGSWTNAVAGAGYDIPNKYKLVSGDVVAYSPNVSLMRKFTVSYILNAQKDLRAGVYTTTINYIASGRF